MLFLRRAGWVLALVFVGLTMMGFAVTAVASLPWWAVLGGLAFWLLVARRRRLGAPAAAVVEGGPQWSPTGRGGL